MLFDTFVLPLLYLESQAYPLSNRCSVLFGKYLITVGVVDIVGYFSSVPEGRVVRQGMTTIRTSFVTRFDRDDQGTSTGDRKNRESRDKPFTTSASPTVWVGKTFADSVCAVRVWAGAAPGGSSAQPDRGVVVS